MWGEIDPPVKSPPSPRESKDKSKLPEAPEVQSQKWEFDRPRETQQPLQDFQCVSRAESICVNAMIEAVAMSGSLVKSQQMGEAELTVNERKEELLYQYRSRPLVFLERYHACLKPQHLSAFAHVSSDPRTQHYSKVIQRRATGHTNRTRVRNKRYAALRALQKEGQYFSEEEMRMREPLLYEQYIGQYLTDEEVLERSQEAMSDGAQGAPGAQGGSTGGLAHLLLNSYQERLIQNRLQEEQEREEGALEEDEDDEDDGGRGLRILESSRKDGSRPRKRRLCSEKSSSVRCTSASSTVKTRISTTVRWMRTQTMTTWTSSAEMRRINILMMMMMMMKKKRKMR
ncbi:coiled-coil domain-containing protein 97 isoform X2 [Stegastes partitus]|uniref:Coiled-coil domain-containing protein 97 isoform X2 n=1 Tax=Stegastes partitus TaxID=144197 RepID=A0A9Y4NV50_9TELE|nr:PREDICTED: coiled-coil domain-containing protein 97 isoform X2 [Stegastes partitus]